MKLLSKLSPLDRRRVVLAAGGQTPPFRPPWLGLAYLSMYPKRIDEAASCHRGGTTHVYLTESTRTDHDTASRSRRPYRGFGFHPGVCPDSFLVLSPLQFERAWQQASRIFVDLQDPSGNLS